MKKLLTAALAAAALVPGVSQAQSSCAVKAGTYKGEWKVIGVGILKVSSVDAKCVATMSYGLEGKRFTDPFSIDTSSGSFKIDCGGVLEGVCTFERAPDDSLKASYADKFKNTNEAMFRAN